MGGKPYKSYGRNMQWNCVDVRDVAQAHRLCAECVGLSNGSRYILGASDRSGELYTWELQARIKELLPGILLNSSPLLDKGKAFNSPRSYCLLAKQELGLQTYPINDTIRET